MSPALPSHLKETELALKQTINLLSGSQDSKTANTPIIFFLPYFKTILHPIARGKKHGIATRCPPKYYLKKIRNLFLYPLKVDPNYSYVEPPPLDTRLFCSFLKGLIEPNNTV